MWTVINAPADSNLSGYIHPVISNEVAAVRVPHFYTEEELRLIVSNIYRRGISWYPNYENKQGVVGISAADYKGMQGGKNEYFRLAHQYNNERQRMFSPALDPLQKLTRLFSERYSVAVAKEAGSNYFMGLIRAMNQKSTLHFDYAPKHMEGWSVSRIDHQLGTVIYLHMPASGGALTVYNKPWDPEDEAYNLNTEENRFRGFDPDFLAGRALVSLRPDPGDLILFHTRNFHQVGEIDSATPRLTCNSFLGVRGTELLFWN